MTDRLPAKQTAIVAGSDGQLVVDPSRPLPELEPGYVLVKVLAVALNPVDTKMVGRLATPGATSGFDFAGTVVASKPAVSECPRAADEAAASPWTPGTRVCGAVNGQNAAKPSEGAFAQYVTVPTHALLRVPEHMTLEEAATLGVGIGTVGLALFRSLQLPATAETVLVYGGSTATGTLALQFLKINGHRAITTCSPQNNELVVSRGAEKVFDYHSPTAIDDIRAHTGNRLKFVLDCVSTAETIAFCQACMGRMGGAYTTTEPFPGSLLTRKRIRHGWVLQPEVLGKEIGWPEPFRRAIIDADTVRWAVGWYQTVQDALDSGRLQAHPVRRQPGGLDGVLRDVGLLEQRKVSGEKLVYRLDSAETR